MRGKTQASCQRATRSLYMSHLPVMRLRSRPPGLPCRHRGLPGVRGTAAHRGTVSPGPLGLDTSGGAFQWAMSMTTGLAPRKFNSRRDLPWHGARLETAPVNLRPETTLGPEVAAQRMFVFLTQTDFTRAIRHLAGSVSASGSRPTPFSSAASSTLISMPA